MFSSCQFASWTSRVWKNAAADFSIAGVSHDTRTIASGDVYIAIRGDRLDGHDFIESAVEKGASGLIVEREIPECPLPQLIVPDALSALWDLARGARKTWTGTVIGITGSVGKTTVKEMTASVLSQSGVVSKTLGNWNNDIGLPLSMLAANQTSDYFVFEAGMNHPGEIDRLAGLLSPDWAVVTTIGKVHIGFFDGLSAVAREKASIFKHSAHALIDAESEWFELLYRHATGETAVFRPSKMNFSVALPGDHMRENACIAAAIGRSLGLSDVQIQKGLDEFTPAPMRWHQIEHKGVVLINDAYNANPLSMRAAVSTFAKLPCAGRRIVVLGGMRELGAACHEEHLELGRFVASFGFDRVITIGELGAQIVCPGERGVTKDEALHILCEFLQAGDAVLFKASRGERLETLLENLKLKI